MANSLYPSYVQIEYHSAFGVHKMTLPTRQWSSAGGASGSFEAWDTTARDAADMVDDLITDIKAVYPSSVVFDLATIYNFPDPDEDPVPVRLLVLGDAGTAVSSAWSKAVQQTFTFRTLSNGIFKLVLLDVPTDNNFDRVPVSSFTAPFLAIEAELTSQANAWSGRDNARPNSAIQASATLNEKLRREYRMQ